VASQSAQPQHSRSGGNRTLRSFAPNERTGAVLALPVIVSPEITAEEQRWNR